MMMTALVGNYTSEEQKVSVSREAPDDMKHQLILVPSNSHVTTSNLSRINNLFPQLLEIVRA